MHRSGFVQCTVNKQNRRIRAKSGPDQYCVITLCLLPYECIPLHASIGSVSFGELSPLFYRCC